MRRESALTPPRLFAALRSGGAGVLSVAATTATAGIIVGVVTLTGLGLKVAGIIVSLAGGQLFLTVLYSAIAVLLLGLAVPVTASYIIAAVMVAPALIQAGVPDVAAHMFIFYYAVLSEVSPPTALSPFAAAAITGGNPFRTMMLTWKYTLPAFLVPFVFTLSLPGLGVLLQAPLPRHRVGLGDGGGRGGGAGGRPRRVDAGSAVSAAARRLDGRGTSSVLRRTPGGPRRLCPYCCGADLAVTEAARSCRPSERQLISGLTATCRIRSGADHDDGEGTRQFLACRKVALSKDCL